MVAFPYFGGKNSHLAWLLPQLPATHTYVEVFGGSAAVLLNRPPSPNEVYNDANGHVVNFFRVLRDPALTDKLLEQLSLTPYSRAEYVWAYDDTTDPVERARRFYVRIRQSINAKPSDRQWVAGNWAGGVSAAAIKSRAWWNSMEGLHGVAERLRRVEFEHCLWQVVFERYDSPNTLFYVDPPYGELRGAAVGNNNVYGIVFTATQQMELAERCKRLKGKVAVSGYAGMFEALYSGWRVESAPAKQVKVNRHTSHAKRALDFKDRSARVEMLWMNYPKQGEEATL